MPDPKPAPARWRLDAVALTLFAVGAMLAAAVGSSRPLTGGPNLLAGVGEFAAAMLVEPLGWGAVAFLAGWFAVAGLLVVTRSPGRIAVRLVGWVVLTACAATAADWSGSKLSPVSIAGPGGSVGAFLRLNIEDALPDPWDAVAFALAVFAGLMLVADWLMIRLATALGAVLRRLWTVAVWGNEKVAAGSDQVIAGLGTVAKAAASAVPSRKGGTGIPACAPGAAQAGMPVPPDVIPITHPDPLPQPEAHHPEDIPIHVHTEPAQLRAVPPPDDGEPAEYDLPALTLLNDPEPFPVEDHEQKLRDVAVLLEKTFQDFGLNVKVVGIHTGPVITQYEVALETGLRLNKVTNLADDLALNLRVPSVRVVAPLPGRNTVGIEVPNAIVQTVRLKELVLALASTPKVAKYKLPLFVGKDVEGRPLAYDLATMPHLLIAGSTGTGKSVCLNTIILSLLLTRRPDECRMILIDPKKVELTQFAQIPHLMTPVVKDDKKADAILAWAVDKMEERYEWLHRARVRNIASYNELPYEEIIRRMNPDSEDERRAIPRSMPYIMILIDEVGDLMMKMKKEIEGNIILLAQKSRAAGIHLVLATQKPTVDVITGLIKSNLPARICFRVTNRSDSAVVLDEKGAERLLGKGDMLFLQTGALTRAQGALVEDDEIERVVDAIATDTPNYDSELLNLKTRDQQGGDDGGSVGEKLRDRDPVYEQAVEIVIREQRGSTSLLQRALGIGYGKASRLIDYMAEDGIVGGYNGSNARQVLISPEEWDSRKAAG
jgi:S-DNA-T family DNA segregation ATPase FtsK/SpoIIIE